MQPGHAIDRPATVGERPVVVLGGDLVADEPRSAGAGVGDPRLCLRQFQLELIAQELTEATFDLLSFGRRSGEPEQEVVGIADVNLDLALSSRAPGLPGRENVRLSSENVGYHAHVSGSGGSPIWCGMKGCWQR